MCQPIKTIKSNVFTTYLHLAKAIRVREGVEANYCYISFIQKTISPLPHVYVYKKTFYKEISEFFCLFGTHQIVRNDVVFDTFSINEIEK